MQRADRKHREPLAFQFVMILVFFTARPQVATNLMRANSCGARRAGCIPY